MTPSAIVRNGSSVFAAAIVAALTTFALACGPAAASVSDLAAFLERAERMAEFPGAVRADITIKRDGEVVDTAVLIIDPKSKREFLALRKAGWRALVPLAWGRGKAIAKQGAPARILGVDDPLPGSDLRPMEFFPFWRTDYSTAFISDSNRLEKTITLYAPANTPYVLFVITFDKEKLVPLVTKYYRENMNNLVRLRRDSNFVMVGSRPRPQRIDITNFADHTETELELRWSVLDQVPSGLMDEARFDKIALEWPAEPVAAR